MFLNKETTRTSKRVKYFMSKDLIQFLFIFESEEDRNFQIRKIFRVDKTLELDTRVSLNFGKNRMELDYFCDIQNAVQLDANLLVFDDQRVIEDRNYLFGNQLRVAVEFGGGRICLKLVVSINDLIQWRQKTGL